MKLHTILPFYDLLTKTSIPSVCWFCSEPCRHKFVSNLLTMRRGGCGTLVERFYALNLNKLGKCAGCENKSEVVSI